MIIKNITDAEFDVMGLSLDSGEEMAISDMGTATQLRQGTDEIVKAISDGNISMMYADGVSETSVQKIVDILDNKVTQTNVTVDSGDGSAPAASNMYYYQNISATMTRGETKDIIFKGFLDNVVITSASGTIEFQIIEPKMTKITVHSLNTFNFDAKNQIKDPIIRITAVTAVSATLMMDGLYDVNERKSKTQYLQEIYSDDSVVEVPIEDKTEKGLFFSARFDDALSLISGQVRDTVAKSIGICKGFENNIDASFTGKTSVEFDPGISINPEEPFTMSIIFEQTDKHSIQYILYKLGQYYLYASNGSLYLNFASSTTKICTIREGVVNNLIITYNGDKEHITVYLNGLYVCTINRAIKIRNYGYSMVVGNNRYNSNYGLRGKIYALNEFNYSMSGGMVAGLYEKLLIENTESATVPGCMVSYYSTGTRGTNHIDNFAEFDSVEKIYGTKNNCLFNEVQQGVNSELTQWNNFKTYRNYITIIQTTYCPSVDGYYEFELQGDDAVELSIDNKVIVADYGGHGVNAMKSGMEFLDSSKTYKLRFRHYQGSGGTSYKCLVKKPGSSEFENIVGELKDNSDTNHIVHETLASNMYPSPLSNSCSITDGIIDVRNKEKIQLQSDDRYNAREFTISLWLNVRNYKESRIFSIGSGDNNWSSWLALEVDNKVAKVYFNRKSVSSKKVILTYEWNKIDICSDGSVIKFYINGALVKGMDFDDRDDYRGTKFFINALPDGTLPRWMDESNYQMRKMTYKDVHTTAEEVKHEYLKETI